ncbi:hypothetical protein MASR2M79_03950 [Aminivibrio sp.]
MGNSSLGGICHSWSATPVAFRGGYPSARNGNALASLLVSTGKGSAAAEQLFFDFGS